MRGNSVPTLERILPTALWEELSERFLRATGLNLVLVGADGSVRGDEEAALLCSLQPAGGQKRCGDFYRKAIGQAAGGEEPLLFRCPQGFLVFGVPLGRDGAHEEAPLVLMGGPARSPPAGEAGHETESGRGTTSAAALERLPRIAPRRLADLARLAHACLRRVVEGHSLKESFARRQAQVMTLFEVGSDLARAGSIHELHALALNTLGVLFDVSCAAVLLRDRGGDLFRTHTAMGALERALQNWSVPASAPDLERLVGQGSPVHLDDAHVLGKLGLPEAVDSVWAFCLGQAGKCEGILAVINTALPAEDQQLVRGLAIQLSLVIENHRLRDEVAQRLREILETKEVSRKFLSCIEPEPLFQAVLEEARRVTGARKASLMLAANGNNGEMVVKAVTGMNDKVIQRLRVRAGQGVAGRVFASGEPIVVQNIEHDPRFRRRNRARYATKSFLSLPITLDTRIIGVLNLADKLSGEIFSDQDLTLLQTMAAQATIAIERSTYYAQTQELRKISITDGLTGLLNRRYFQERLTEEVDRATRHGHPLALIMVDIDHFKAYNDANGHPEGDKALVLVGRALRAGVRVIDVVSRFGGEEFAVILPETRRAEAMEIGERLRQEVENLYFQGEESLPSGRLTISLGVAAFPEDARDLKALIQRADRALYLAKAQGRNRIAAYAGPAADKPVAEVAPPPSWTKLL